MRSRSFKHLTDSLSATKQLVASRIRLISPHLSSKREKLSATCDKIWKKRDPKNFTVVGIRKNSNGAFFPYRFVSFCASSAFVDLEEPYNALRLGVYVVEAFEQLHRFY